MAQTILSVYAGDQLYKCVAYEHWASLSNAPSFSYFIRIVGTLLGLITALLIWYIGRRIEWIYCKRCSCKVSGSGSGNGNPYGLAASYGVITLPVMFIRLFTPAKYLQGVILGTVCILRPSLTPLSLGLGHSDPCHRILVDRWSPASAF
jgi:hypothetical protein